MSDREEYQRTLHTLQQHAKGLPHVRQDFLLDVASMCREELQRRVLVQSDWHGHFSHAMDKHIEQLRKLGLSGVPIEGCMQPDDVQEVIQQLLEKISE